LGDQRDVNGPPVSPELEIETRANADYSVGLLRARRALPAAGHGRQKQDYELPTAYRFSSTRN